MLCIRGTSHGPVSVCLSVCPSQVGVLLKRLNRGSHKQHHTIAQGLYFSGAKDLREIPPGSPLRGRQMHVGWVKIIDFRHITGYIYIRLFHHEGSTKSITDKNIKVTGQGQEVCSLQEHKVISNQHI